jgi:hypothetical protein
MRGRGYVKDRRSRPRRGRFGVDAARPIELYQLDAGLMLVDAASELRCAVGEEESIGWLPGFDRPGVLVRLTPEPRNVKCSISAVDDVAQGTRVGQPELGSTDDAAWSLMLVAHWSASFMGSEMAAGIVRAELSTYEHIRLDVPPETLGIFEAPRSVTQSGELVALALRAAGCPIGPQVRERPPVEHPDLYADS